MSEPPRIYGIPATHAPIVAVLRRGPTAWTHLGRWDLARGAYEPGSWTHTTVYPQRCDLSPDGRWFCYFTLKVSARWTVGPTYNAISRLPWFTALAAWGTCGTWSRGLHFVDDRTIWQVPEPAAGDAAPCRARYGLALTRPVSFAVERRRGWTETADTPPRDERDLWDERRAERVRMAKPRPRDGATRLVVGGGFAAFRESREWWKSEIRYELVGPDGPAPLDDVQWADWAGDGSLLVATRDGRLQVRQGPPERLVVAWEHDLASLTPETAPPPAHAREW
ncbi:MAG TPA: hypothetical protein VNN07_10195 [Candidatus Tectomicrobia bacterium]|nr:hypothetical protein [Candidatus Tectomicrobia bacterium]